MRADLSLTNEKSINSDTFAIRIQRRDDKRLTKEVM